MQQELVTYIFLEEKKRFDKTLESQVCKSRPPDHDLNQHAEEKLTLIAHASAESEEWRGGTMARL